MEEMRLAADVERHHATVDAPFNLGAAPLEIGIIGIAPRIIPIEAMVTESGTCRTAGIETP